MSEKPICINLKDHFGGVFAIKESGNPGLIEFGKEMSCMDVITGKFLNNANVTLNRTQATFVADVLARYGRTGKLSAEAEPTRIWEEGDKPY